MCALGCGYHSEQCEQCGYHWGVPVWGVPVWGVPVWGVPVWGVPVWGVPVWGVPVWGVPVLGVPEGDVSILYIYGQPKAGHVSVLVIL